jgi:hypothetical protein
VPDVPITCLLIQMSISQITGRRRTKLYLHVDLVDVERAFALPVTGAAIRLWVAVTWQAAVSRSRVVVVTNQLCRRFGVTTRPAKRRALIAWEEVGFWRVDRLNGKNPTVEIIKP